jgi:hypothetical protein
MVNTELKLTTGCAISPTCEVRTDHKHIPRSLTMQQAGAVIQQVESVQQAVTVVRHTGDHSNRINATHGSGKYVKVREEAVSLLQQGPLPPPPTRCRRQQAHPHEGRSTKCCVLDARTIARRSHFSWSVSVQLYGSIAPPRIHSAGAPASPCATTAPGTYLFTVASSRSTSEQGLGWRPACARERMHMCVRENTHKRRKTRARARDRTQ